MNQPPVVTLEHLSVRLGDIEALTDVSVEIPAACLTALIGPNGSGKSTLLKALLGLVPYRGTVTFNLAGGPIGYVPQRLDLERTLPVTVGDYMAALRHRWPVALGLGRRRHGIVDTLARLDAAHLVDRPLGGLSGGELQRVMLALAIEPTPRLLLLDEPASGMDLRSEQRLYDIVKKLIREHACAVVMVSHDLSVVSDMTDHVLCLNRRLICRGGPRDILTDATIAEVFGHGHAVYHHRHEADGQHDLHPHDHGGGHVH